MHQENENTNKRMNASYRPFGELIRGIFFILFGLYAFFSEQLGFRKLNFEPAIVYTIGGLLCAYGLYRVYRGIKQLFF